MHGGGTALGPGLYLVSTPIGAARDITLRALDVLAEADVLAAEDTRTLRHLMGIHGIPLGLREIVAYHDHNAPKARPRLLAALAEGKSVAYASEAGTPLVADPGYDLARAAGRAGYPVRPVPGASAMLAALTVAGLPTDRFLFAGFAPASGAARRTWLRDLSAVAATLVIYEAPHRIREMLADLSDIFGPDRQAALCRELTKRFEDVQRVVALRPGEVVTIRIEREGQTSAVRTRLGAYEERDRFGQTYRIGRLGFLATGRELERVSAADLLPEAARYTWVLTKTTMEGLWQIIAGRRSVEELGGPLKIAQVAGQQASLGPFQFVQLLALISINLGFINLLPVPMLDGGHLLFYTLEAVRRRPVSVRVQEWAFRGGLALLLALLLFTTVNDLGSFGLWDRLERLIG